MKRIPPAVRRELLLDAAFRVIARNGVQAATTRAVCAEANMPLASFHYVFESQAELMRELMMRVIDDSGDSDSFPEFTDDIYRNVELMINSTFNYSLNNPNQELAYYELSSYALRSSAMADLPKARIDRAVELIERAFNLLQALHPEAPPLVVDLRDLAWMVLTFIEGNGWMYLNSHDEEATRRAITAFSIFVVDFAYGKLPQAQP